MTANEMLIELRTVADVAETLALHFEGVKPGADPCVLAKMARADLEFVANAITVILDGESAF